MLIKKLAPLDSVCDGKHSTHEKRQRALENIVAVNEWKI